MGCGCRGRELAGALVADGHSVRGTSRSRARMADIEAAGAEPVLADPDRLGTLLPHIEGVSAVCWLLGPVGGEAAEALHGPRLQSMLTALVDTPVRGMVYEGPADEIVARFARTYRMPVQVVGADSGDHGAWLVEARAAVAKVLGA